jgi:sulfur carrier protein
MHVKLSHPDRSVDIKGPKKARDVLRELNLVQEAHLVIRGDELITEDELLKDGDVVEIRPVISGGSIEPQARGNGLWAIGKSGITLLQTHSLSPIANRLA